MIYGVLSFFNNPLFFQFIIQSQSGILIIILKWDKPGFFCARRMKPMSVMFLQLSTLTCRNSRNANVVENVESVRGTFPTSKNAKFKSSILEDEKEMCVTIWPKKNISNCLISDLICRICMSYINRTLDYFNVLSDSNKISKIQGIEAFR